MILSFASNFFEIGSVLLAELHHFCFVYTIGGPALLAPSIFEVVLPLFFSFSFHFEVEVGLPFGRRSDPSTSCVVFDCFVFCHTNVSSTWLSRQLPTPRRKAKPDPEKEG